MLIPHKGHTDTIQVYSVTVMTHVKALQAGHSSQGTSEPITPIFAFIKKLSQLFYMYMYYVLTWNREPGNKRTSDFVPTVVGVCRKLYNICNDSHANIL